MTEEATKRNPASNLIEIFNKASHGDANTDSRIVWCKVFEISEEDTEEALFEVQKCLLALRQLLKETEEALLRLSNVNKELFVDPLQRLGEAIDINHLHWQWENFKRHIRYADLLALNYCEDLLGNNPELQENEIPSDEIQEILAELNKLYEAILASSLPEDLTSALLDLIQEMLRDIHEYRVRGAIALKEALTKSIGILAANKQALEENKDSEEIQGLGRMLVRIDKAYTFAMKVRPLLEAAGNLFPALAAHIK